MIPVKPAENFPSRKVDASAFSKSKRWRAVSNYGRAKSVRLLEDNFDPYHKPDAPAVEHADQKINPFQPLDGNYGGPPIPPYEWFKLIITGPVVFLVRVLLLIPTLSLMVIIAHIAVFRAEISSPAQDAPPFSRWRLFLVTILQKFTRLVLFICGFYWIKLKKHPSNKGQAMRVIVSNHCCVMDSLVHFSNYQFSPVGIQETASTPVFGSVSKALQMIYVDRLAKDSTEYVKKEILRRAQPGTGFPPILIFPEGVCKDTTCLVRFRAGAFVPGQPVLPLIIRYPHWFFNPAWTVPSKLRQLRILFQFINFVEVEELPIYYPNETEKSDPILFAENVRDAMARHMGVPVTDHTIQDTVLALDAVRMQVEMGGVNFAMLKRENSRITLDQSRDLIKVFKKMDVSNHGTVNFDDFCRALMFDPEDTLASRIFTLMDMDGNGQLNYHEFVYGMHVLLMQCKTTEDFMGMSFDFYDDDNDGYVTLDQTIAAFSKLQCLLNEGTKEPENVPFQKRITALEREFKALSDSRGQVDKEGFKELFVRVRNS